MKITIISLTLFIFGLARPAVADGALSQADFAPKLPVFYFHEPDPKGGLTFVQNGGFYAHLQVMGWPPILNDYHLYYPPTVWVGYAGRLCPGGDWFSVGVVQDHKLIATVRGAKGGHGSCTANFRTAGLHDGVFELFAFNDAGEYDSNFGRNYPFTLERPTGRL